MAGLRREKRGEHVLKHSYKHIKHTDTKREMSICIFEKCNSYSEAKEKVNELGSFKRFI